MCGRCMVYSCTVVILWAGMGTADVHNVCTADMPMHVKDWIWSAMVGFHVGSAGPNSGSMLTSCAVSPGLPLSPVAFPFSFPLGPPSLFSHTYCLPSECVCSLQMPSSVGLCLLEKVNLGGHLKLR